MLKDDKIRKVNLDAMTLEEIDALSQRLGDKLSEILNKASEEANSLANIYGMKVNITYQLKKVNEETH